MMGTSTEDYQRFQRNLCLLIVPQVPLSFSPLRSFSCPLLLEKGVSIGDKLFNYHFIYSFIRPYLWRPVCTKITAGSSCPIQRRALDTCTATHSDIVKNSLPRNIRVLKEMAISTYISANPGWDLALSEALRSAPERLRQGVPTRNCGRWTVELAKSGE